MVKISDKDISRRTDSLQNSIRKDAIGPSARSIAKNGKCL